MKSIHALAAAVLLVSALIGSYILATDSYLWSQAPTHADGLIAFTVLDLVLIVGLWWKPKLAVIGMTLLALVQFGAMGADLFVGASTFGQAALPHSRPSRPTCSATPLSRPCWAFKSSSSLSVSQPSSPDAGRSLRPARNRPPDPANCAPRLYTATPRIFKFRPNPPEHNPWK